MLTIDTKNTTVKGLRHIIEDHGMKIEFEDLRNKSLSALVRTGTQVIFSEVIKEEDLPLNKECRVYRYHRLEYVKAKATRYIYHKLLELGFISIRQKQIV